MDSQPIDTAQFASLSTNRKLAPSTCSLAAGPTAILLAAIAIGLSAGFLDLGLLLLKKHWNGDAFSRLGEHYSWLIPAGVGAIIMVPGFALAMVAKLRRDRLSLQTVVGFLSFGGFLDACSRLPLEFWSALLLSAGLAVQFACSVKARPEGFLRILRWSCLLLVGGLLAIMLLTFGRRVWFEHQAVAQLPPPPAKARNVLLIVWDTVRAANLSLYGYGRTTSPQLVELARKGVRFEQAFATAPWTLPSHSSLFTGRWPHELTANWNVALDDTYLTLAAYLASQGYDTGGFVANLDYCSWESGLSRGFAHYEDHPLEPWDILTRYTGIGSRLDLLTPASVINRLLKKYWGDAYDVIPRAKEHVKNAASVNRSFLSWLTWQQKRERPFFTYLNFNDAHSPYEVPDRSAPAFGLRPVSYLDRLTLRSWDTIDKAQLSGFHVQMAIDVYDDAIAYLDRCLGALMDELRTRGVLEDTLIVFASDHGEHLGDHFLFGHGCSLYRQLVGVPLVIVAPGDVPAGRVVVEPVSLRDVPATVVSLLGLTPDTAFPGRSLARFWTGKDPARSNQNEPLLMETEKPTGLINQGREPAARGPMKSLVAEGMHYVRTADGLEELYLLKSDPEEQTNLAAGAYPFASDALQRFRAKLAAMLVQQATPLSLPARR